MLHISGIVFPSLLCFQRNFKIAQCCFDPHLLLSEFTAHALWKNCQATSAFLKTENHSHWSVKRDSLMISKQGFLGVPFFVVSLLLSRKYG